MALTQMIFLREVLLSYVATLNDRAQRAIIALRVFAKCG